MSQKRTSFFRELDWLDWVFIVVASCSIGYGLYRAIDLGTDRWGDVAGPLFSLASGFLFVVALRMQMREHRHALVEMEQNNANHAALLLITKQEKHLQTALKAIEELSLVIYNNISNERNSAHWIQRNGTNWINLFRTDHFYSKMSFVNMENYETVFLFSEYSEIDAVIQRLEWINKAIVSNNVDLSDKKYLQVIYEPLRIEVYAQLSHVFNNIDSIFSRALDHPDVRENEAIKECVLKHRRSLEALRDRLVAAEVK